MGICSGHGEHGAGGERFLFESVREEETTDAKTHQVARRPADSQIRTDNSGPHTFRRPIFFTCEYLQFSEIRGRKTVCGPDCKERTQGRFIEMGVRCVLEVSLLAALETVHERRYAPHLAVWAWGRPLLGPCMHKSFRTP